MIPLEDNHSVDHRESSSLLLKIRKQNIFGRCKVLSLKGLPAHAHDDDDEGEAVAAKPKGISRKWG